MAVKITGAVWVLLMAFKAITALMVIATPWAAPEATPMPNGAQIWFAMLVAFITSAEVTVTRLMKLR